MGGIAHLGHAYRFQIVESVELRTQATMYAQKLFVHYCGERQSAERIHASLVNMLGILVLTFELECEVICKMTALVIASQQPESVWIPDFQGPEVQNALLGQ